MGAARDGSALLAGAARLRPLRCQDDGALLAGSRPAALSPNTVNAHTRSVYTKLGVGDRSSAVQRARELRLLAADRAR